MIARLEVKRGPLTEYPLAEKISGGWQNGVTFYPDSEVTKVTELVVRAAHDEQCEAEYVVGASCYSDCGCSDRSLEAVKAETVQPVFGDSLPNDGRYEYTTTSDCDGRDLAFYRRLPARHADAALWERITAEEHLAASRNWQGEWRPVSTVGDNRG